MLICPNMNQLHISFFHVLPYEMKMFINML